jgi:hypothetical protein
LKSSVNGANGSLFVALANRKTGNPLLLLARLDVALAISNFLRQHDLVQVQWVFLSSVPEHPSETSLI